LNKKLEGSEVYTAVNKGPADLCLLQNVRTGPETHPATFSGYQVSFLQVKRQGPEVNYTLLCFAEVENDWGNTLLSHLSIWRGRGKLYLTAMNNNP